MTSVTDTSVPAGGAALLVRVHGVPGFTRITSNDELAKR